MIYAFSIYKITRRYDFKMDEIKDTDVLMIIRQIAGTRNVKQAIDNPDAWDLWDEDQGQRLVRGKYEKTELILDRPQGESAFQIAHRFLGVASIMEGKDFSFRIRGHSLFVIGTVLARTLYTVKDYNPHQDEADENYRLLLKNKMDEQSTEWPLIITKDDWYGIDRRRIRLLTQRVIHHYNTNDATFSASLATPMRARPFPKYRVNEKGEHEEVIVFRKGETDGGEDDHVIIERHLLVDE